MLSVVAVGCKKNDSEEIDPVTTEPVIESQTPTPTPKPNDTTNDSSDSSGTDSNDDSSTVTESDSNIENYVYEPEELIPVWSFSNNSSYADWSNPEPFINPMGAEENYSEISVQEEYYIGFYYVDNENVLKSRSVYGDTWEMQIPYIEDKTNEENNQFIYDLEQYVIEKGYIIVGRDGDGFIYQAIDAEGVRWWAQAEPYSTYFILRIARPTII